MLVRGEMLIGRASVRGTDSVIRALDPANNAALEPDFGGGGTAEVERACRLADEAFDSYSRTDPEERAQFIEAVGRNIASLGETLVTRVMAETGLPGPRVEGEMARTVSQLNLFATVVRKGLWRDATIDAGDPQRKPLPRPDLRMQKIAIGPVGVFGSSNFPLLYSVAGGDTASALAAGCPVVVKAHGSHLGTSELVGRAIQKAVSDAGFHEGVYSLLIGEGNAIGEALVDHPAIKAVGFTGSEGGGMALVRRGQQRSEPIPVFAEMTSVNPSFVLPAALAARAETFARAFIDQMTIGVGQMCLKPGLVLAIEGDGFERLRVALRDALSARPAATMLSPNIYGGFMHGVERQQKGSGVTELGAGSEPAKDLDGQVHVFEVDAGVLLHSMELADEVFGPAALLVRCRSFDEMLAIAGRLHGQLTMTLQMEVADIELAQRLMPVLERRTNRILANGFSNVAEISYATIHGGPFPATSDSRFTSVGTSAIDRFLRPVCYQNLPPELLPPALQDRNPLSLWRIRDGELMQG
ncbi:aldehyde dehydrogenase (NADP(+)) [Caballeronia sp. dw_19]|uniref:aldehyde dehydrogenase (NADP(+)) n=1 Tax=Caballeronia sp. dw_19 TaxID=2719791 RepID=UPI001BD6844D|nr:aldehyde dehydrogenase (NADP(+)) [Caballeronia sp. dw_19]